jgi:hypothetical protein
LPRGPEGLVRTAAERKVFVHCIATLAALRFLSTVCITPPGA